jgi:hypothetical protein
MDAAIAATHLRLCDLLQPFLHVGLIRAAATVVEA